MLKCFSYGSNYIFYDRRKSFNSKFRQKKKERLKKPDWLKIRVGDPTNQNAVLKVD
jgi:hypothetical protein